MATAISLAMISRYIYAILILAVSRGATASPLTECNAAASEINKTAPMMIDKFTMFTGSVCYSDTHGRPVYLYSIKLTIPKAQLPKQAASELRKTQLNSNCSNPATRKVLKEWDLEYKYFDSDGIFVLATRIREQDCNNSKTPAGSLEDGFAAAKRGDHASAFKIFRSFAEQGDAKRQFLIATMYYEGTGIEKNIPEAVKWYRLAVAQGDVQAQFNLGVLYRDGQGVAQNYAEAAKLFELAAAQGKAPAQYELGLIYGQGQGVAQNLFRSYMWSYLSASLGHTEAIRNRDYAATLMTSEQIAQAQKMARDCQQRNYKGC